MSKNHNLNTKVEQGIVRAFSKKLRDLKGFFNMCGNSVVYPSCSSTWAKL